MRTTRFAAILVMVILCVPAEARITKQTVNRAWKRITEADGFERVEINYEKDSDPNAWVLWQDNDNFTMHVTTGMLDILDTEAEIAGVLGHEIGHVKCGHYDGMVLSDTASTIMNTHLDRMDSLSEAVGKIDTELREAVFNREQETEADEYGVHLLSKAGYDVNALYRAMSKFGESGGEGFSAHPATSERMRHLAELTRGEKAPKPQKHNDVNHDEIDDIANVLMGQ